MRHVNAVIDPSLTQNSHDALKLPIFLKYWQLYVTFLGNGVVK